MLWQCLVLVHWVLEFFLAHLQMYFTFGTSSVLSIQITFNVCNGTHLLWRDPFDFLTYPTLYLLSSQIFIMLIQIALWTMQIYDIFLGCFCAFMQRKWCGWWMFHHGMWCALLLFWIMFINLKNPYFYPFISINANLSAHSSLILTKGKKHKIF